MDNSHKWYRAMMEKNVKSQDLFSVSNSFQIDVDASVRLTAETSAPIPTYNAIDKNVIINFGTIFFS